ncbi:MAG: aminotransferase class I/II-fold pyridoxal phosphate-dependent enzyme [Candidatus Lokiarchaeota archaeon]|nr:aminotransferase class I/II-fold pyridoxal phosphate-dependent enzyme [Candidatus Lokiarchaeota archaeon]
MKELSHILANKTPKSKIRQLFDLASGRSDIISLGIGQPDFRTPEPIIQGNIRALEKNITQYAPTRGIPELLQLIGDKFSKKNNTQVDWKHNIILSNGGSQALTLTFASLFNPGDEIILFSPNFISYFYLGSFFGVNVKEVRRKKDFSPDFESLKKMINEKTKAILINSPNNPTGYVFTPNEIRELIEIVLEFDLYLISDEVYENYVYDGIEHISPASFKGLFERTITINAMSKLYSATGFRLGYVVANNKIIDLMEKYHQYTIAGTNHAAQYGFKEALKMNNNFFNDIFQSFTERRDYSFKRLKEIGFEVVKPKGAFYIMPSVEEFNLTGQEFSEKIIKEKGVAIVPGDVFGKFSNNSLRISYAIDIKLLEEAMARIEDFVKML